jgi:hypothetical protein
VALHHFARARSAAEVVAGWEGPLGKPQDFAFPGLGAFEVKAVGSTSTRIKISSAEQLDAPSGDLELIVIRLPTAAEESPGSFSLISLMREASQLLADEPESEADLRFKVGALGVDPTRDLYRSTHFVAESMSRFKVGDGFPALRASELSTAITAVRYEVALAAMAPFLIQHTKL